MSTAGPRAIRNQFGARPRPRGYGPDETGRLIECDVNADPLVDLPENLVRPWKVKRGR